LDTESATPDVKKILVQRMQELREEHHEINTLLVEWTIVAHPEQIIQFQREGQEQAWLTSLREQFGEGERLAWSASLQFEPAGTLPPQWREDDTLRGDFLAMMHAVETGEVALSLDAEDFPLDQNDTDEIQQMLGGFTSQEIMELNLEIALRGVDLLSGQEGVEAKS